MADSFMIWPGWEDRLRAAGIESADDALRRATCIRDLPQRSNHELTVDGAAIHLKLRKPGRWPWRRTTNRERDGLVLARRLHLPVPELVLSAENARIGALVGTLSLAPARPLDELLRDRALSPPARRRVVRRLASAVATLHRARHHHRDLYLNHVFVIPDAPDPLRGIIDWERHGTHRRALSRWVVKDLASLLASTPDGSVTRREQGQFLALYARATGVGAWQRARLARRVQAKAARIRRHVPRTPVGDAARPLEGLAP